MMMKKIALVLLTLCLAACFAIGLAGCADGKGPSSETGGFIAPTELEINSSGKLTWKKVDGATGYEVSIDGSDYTAVTETQIDIFTLIDDVSVTKIYVRAKNDTQTTAAAELAVTVKQLSAPAKPAVSEDEETHAVRFTWTEVENANRYGVKVNDNANWVSIKNNYWTLTSEGEYSIAVKCLAYVDGTTIYLESAASETSETVSYIAGPVLFCDTLNEIYWQLEDGASFAQYDLWIDGKEAAADIGYYGNEDPLDLVEEGYLTKTGEYDIQIKAIKENGSFAWSNMLSEFGTGNINPNEFYSFDNRIFVTPIAKEGVGVSDEKYHGESGYSLKIEPGSGGGQINMVKYEGALDDVDLRYVRSISYWVYLEPLSGVTDSTVDTADAFKVVYDDSLGNYQNRIVAAGKSDYEDGTKIPVKTWTKVTIDSCLNEYENVIILGWTTGMSENYTIYLDDILVEKVETLPEGTSYTAQYTPAGGWFSGAGAKVAENQTPGASVTLKVILQTSADGKADENIKMTAMNGVTGCNANWQDCYTDIDTSKTGWREVFFEAKVAADGNLYLGAAYMADDGSSFSIYIKDVEIVPSHTVKFETNGGSDVADVDIAEGASLAGFDVKYTSTKENLVFCGWYTSATFDEGTRVGRDVTVMPSNAVTVYAKWGDAYDYIAEFDGTAGWFSGKAAKVAEGLTPEAAVTVKLKLQTSLDGVADNNVALAAFKGSAAGNDTWQDSFTKIDTSKTGWREVIFEAKVASDGCLYLGGAYMADDGAPLNIYMKDITVKQSYTVTFETNGGSNVADVKIAEGASLADFDVKYITTKENQIFCGWYTSATFDEGTRVGTDVTVMPANALTVYAKWGDAYEYIAEFDGTAGWFSGKAAKVAEGLTPEATVTVVLKLQTTLDGIADNNVALAAFKGAAAGNDTWQDNFIKLDTSKTGWREVIFEAKVASDGCLYLGGAYLADAGAPLYIYMKDIEVFDHYVAVYDGTAGWFSGTAVKAAEGLIPESTVTIVLKLQTTLDGVADSNAALAAFKGAAAGNDTWQDSFTKLDTSKTGWREVTFEAKVASDGCLYLGGAYMAEDGPYYRIYMKDVQVEYKAHYYSQSGSWFGGESAQVSLSGVRAGETVVLSMQVKTSQDGTEGADVVLYQTNSQWQGADSSENFENAAALSPATASGWREVCLTVTLTEDGYVWLGSASKNPSLGECFVYISDVRVVTA